MRTQPYLAAKELTDSYLTTKNLASKPAASPEESNKMGGILQSWGGSGLMSQNRVQASADILMC